MALKPIEIKIIIFDLDDTLFDTHGLLIKPAAKESCQAMIDAGLKTKLKGCLETREVLLNEHPRLDIFQQLVHKIGVEPHEKPEEVIEAGQRAFYERPIREKITVFNETKPTLTELQKKHALYLVTFGAPRTQSKKIDQLELDHFFKKIFYVDFAVSKSKILAFEEIMTAHQVKPNQILSVGNRIDSEIKDAKILGMQTVLMSHGEYIHLMPQNDFEKPDAEIKNLSELLHLLK